MNRKLLLLALASSLVSVATAQEKTASNSTPGVTTDPDGLAVVEITGSLIRSSEKVQFNQVQTITPEDIQATGSVTVADYLHDLAVNSASSWGDNFAYGATGGAGIAMRGLSEKYTLVLVDGQRVAPYGFPSNGTDTFVDLNTIPLNAIERIEIVHDVRNRASERVPEKLGYEHVESRPRQEPPGIPGDTKVWRITR